MSHLYLSTPSLYSLELTFECNNACPGCANAPTKNIPHGRLLMTSDWEKILNSLPNVQFLKITGGEPTLHPGFYDILQRIESSSTPFTLFTNGRWRDPERVVEALVSNKFCESVLVSLHGADAYTHERFTATPGSWEETLTNIQIAIRSGLFVALSCVITEYNVGQIDAVVALAKRIGAGAVIFSRYLEQVETTPLTVLRAAVKVIENLRRDSGLPVRWGNCIPQCFVTSSSTGCSAGISSCTIDPWGNVRPCNYSPLICGNLLTQSIEEIWHSQQMSYWRQLIPDECYICPLIEQCHGGCRAMQLITGLDRDPLMRVPPSIESVVEKPVTLYALARPRLCGDVRREWFGWALIGQRSFAPIGTRDMSLLDVMDGTITLEQLQRDFGKEVLSTIVSWLEKGLICLSDGSDEFSVLAQ